MLFLRLTFISYIFRIYYTQPGFVTLFFNAQYPHTISIFSWNIYLFKKKEKSNVKKKLSSYSVFYANRRDKIYASIRIASPRPTIVRNDNVSQINFPAIIPRSAGIGDLARFNRASIPSLPKLSSPFIAPPPRNQISPSSFIRSFHSWIS